MSEIPGAGVLGYGFNILGEYDISSVTRQIFEHRDLDSQSYTYQPTGLTYQVPDNTTVIPNTTTTGASQVFSTRQQVQTYFAAKAGAKGSYGAFSGEFNAAYSQTFNTDVSYSYGLYEADFTGWNLALADQSSNWLSPGFIGDPDIETLPDTFTAQNQEQFFTVFRKFGTHFVSQVTVGGAMNYFVAVMKSYQKSEAEIQANIALEFKAVFYSASAESSAEWKQLGESWAESRVVRVDAVGGDTSPLNALDPEYGDCDKGIFDTWSSAVMQNPAVVGFTLRPLNVLFSGPKATAVQQALSAYTNGAIIASGTSDYTPGHAPGGGNFTTGSSIIVSGTIIEPNPPVQKPAPYKWPNYDIYTPVGGYQIALLDRTSLEPIMSHVYYQDPSSESAEQHLYDDIMRDIDAVTATDYIAVVAGFAVDLMNYPSQAFSTWLASVGAEMSGWKDYLGFTGSPGQASYVCIGRKGLMPGGAVESFAAATDWADDPSASTTDASGLVLIYTNPPAA